MNDERVRDAALLLKDAAILYERYGAGRPEPFNVFSVLRKDKDEVNLHSRFLAALLDHRKPGEERRANLHDFIREFVPESLRGFAPDGAKVERERDGIDILITNDRRQALAIENKICAEDRHRQLKNYHGFLARQGYKDIHLLYLTIDGREPSKDSIGDLGKNEYTSMAYKDIVGWLERCRKQAYDEPELRDSIVQYSRLIKRMTGDDQESEFMTELGKLCLRDNNLLVAHHLAGALLNVKAFLVHDMWKKIRDDLNKKLKENISLIEKRSDISEDAIRRIIRKDSGNFGLYYSFGHEPACLCVEANRKLGFIVGIGYEKIDKFDDIKSRIQNKLGPARERPEWWPWCCILQPDGTGLNSNGIEKLSNDEARNELAKHIARSAGEKLNAIFDELNSACS